MYSYSYSIVLAKASFLLILATYYIPTLVELKSYFTFIFLDYKF